MCQKYNKIILHQGLPTLENGTVDSTRYGWMHEGSLDHIAGLVQDCSISSA